MTHSPDHQHQRQRREELLSPSCEGQTDLFFSERTTDMRTAQVICSTCTVRQDCLDAARELPPFAGVWGGVIFVNGEEQLLKRGRGRPRKSEQLDNARVLKALGTHAVNVEAEDIRSETYERQDPVSDSERQIA